VEAAYFFIAGLATALVLAMASLWAFYRYSRHTRNNSSKIRGYLDLIPDLTQVQRDQVQEIRRTFLPRVDSIREGLCRERSELARLLFEEPPDRTRINSIANQIMQHQSELEYEVIEHILEERELLSPSQRRKFYEIIIEQFASGGLGVHDVKGRR
jgi:Spy/CpxP family protein refolding chaperone